jgi:hypothetical protein
MKKIHLLYKMIIKMLVLYLSPTTTGELIDGRGLGHTAEYYIGGGKMMEGANKYPWVL